MTSRISEFVLGQLDDGTTVKQYKLRNARGTEATFLNLGAAWTGFQRPEDLDSLVLGCDSLEAFIHQRAFLGATIGRYANRINQGRFTLDGETIQLDVNLPPHHLHGGHDGFSSKVWSSNITLVDDTQPTLTFEYKSPAGEAGFPGNVTTTVTITLSDDDSVTFQYHAITDAPTILNITNHTYFNLQGRHAGSLEGHEFKLMTQRFLDSDENALPSGDVAAVEGTALDLTEWTDVYNQLNPITDPLLKRADGYDHCYCFDHDQQLKPLAYARSRSANTVLICESDLPGMQFYTGNFLGGTPIDEQTRYQQHGAFCMEPGYWTDSPNHEHFPSCRIDENNAFSAIIKYSFKAMEE